MILCKPVGIIAIFTALTATAAQINSAKIPSSSHAAISSTQLTDAPFLFQTGSNTLRKIRINLQADGSPAISQEVRWDAGSLLTTTHVPEQRTIATYHPAIKQTVAFKLEQLPADIQTLFNTSPATNSIDDLGKKRVSYLRGDRAMERKNTDPAIPKFRLRTSVLGDITHNAPVYIDAPAKNLVGADYSSFYEQHKTRPGAVFVGANDGMLHAFSADSGAELFAYIPSPLLKKLPRLTDLAYQHESMMDGNLQVSEAHVLGQWKTVLAAGMGYGAKGVFALDVTASDKFMEGKRALFEFTEKDDADMGYITSSPSIAKINMGKSKNGSITYKYFVVVTSGDNDANNSEKFLFLLSLDKDPTAPWFKNSNYYKLSANSNDASTNNALSAPGLVLNAQGAAIYAYSGDLQGNVWRFDFTGEKPDSITPEIIFTAKDRNNNPQAITAQPVVTFAPDGGYLVLFGTGDNTKNTKDHLKQNSFYALRDTIDDRKEHYFINDRSKLAARELTTSTIKGESGLQITGNEFSYSNSKANKKGWYFDYNQCGERSTSKSELAFGSIFFNTVIPGGALCNEHGSSISYTVNAMTGKSTNATRFTALKSQVGMVGAPLLVTTKPSLGERDSMGRRFNTQPYFVLNVGTGGVHGSSEVIDSGKATLKAGRLSWREISNWQDLKK